MKGSFKKDDTKDTAETLRVKVAELEKRRQKIQSEIDVYYRNCKTKLNLEYKELIDKHYKEYNEKISELNKRETIIENAEIALSVQKDKLKTDLQSAIDTVEKRSKELDLLIIEYNKKTDDLERKYKDKLTAMDKQIADIISERESIKKTEKTLKDSHSTLTELQNKNQEETIRLNNLIQEVEAKNNSADYFKKELKAKEEDVDRRERAVFEAESSTDIKNKIKEAERIEKEANTILQNANKVAEDNQKEHSVNETKADELVALSASLQALRETLNETKLSLEEKERFLILKDRAIDGKIKTLNELRKQM